MTELGHPVLVEIFRPHSFLLFIEEFDNNHLVFRGILVRLVVLGALNVGLFGKGIIRLLLARPM